MNNEKKRLLFNIGMGMARIVIPGVPAVEEAIKGFKKGKDKAEAVDKMVMGGLETADWLTNYELLEDPEFREGVKLYREGTVKIMKAVERLQEKNGK